MSECIATSLRIPAHARLLPGRRCEPSQQMIPRTGAGDVQQVAFRVVDLFQIRVIGHCLDPCL